MSIALVSQGAIAASGSPAFGAVTGSGHLLLAWVASTGNGAAASITTTATGWSQADAGGAAFNWAAVWYKPNCGAAETPPVFTDPNGSVTYSQLAEFSGAATATPVDQHGNGFSGGGNSFWEVRLAADADAGDLLAAVGFWNGANAGGTISITQFTDSAGAAVTPTLQQAANGSGLYFGSLWGITGNTGNSGDDVFLNLSVFDSGGGAVVSFKPAAPVVNTLTVPAQTLPKTWLSFPYSTRTVLGTGGTPPYTWTVTAGALPTGLTLSSAGVLAGTNVSAAGTFAFTAQVTDSAARTATGGLSVTVSSPPVGFTSLTTTSSLTGNLGPYNDPAQMTPASNGFTTYVAANQVSPTASYSQTLGAYSPAVFYVTANAGPAGTGQVQMGPCNSQQFTNWGTGGWNGSSNTPLSALSKLNATFDVTNPIGGAWELELDIWTGYTGGSASGTIARDIMIWLDTSTERGTGGAILHTTGLTFADGLTYDFYYYPYPYPNGPIAGAELIFILQGAGGSGTFGHMTSGTVDLLGPLLWCVQQGFDLGGGRAPYIDLILFGWEICNTDVIAGGASTQAENFICNDFSYSYALAGSPASVVTRRSSSRLSEAYRFTK